MRNTHLFILCLAMGGGAVAAPPAYQITELPQGLRPRTAALAGRSFSEKFRFKFHRPQVTERSFQLDEAASRRVQGFSVPAQIQSLTDRPGFYPVVRVEATEVERAAKAVPPPPFRAAHVWGPGTSIESRPAYIPGELARAVRNLRGDWDLTVFPVQIETSSGDALVIRNAEVAVDWIAEPDQHDSPGVYGGGADAVIITRDALVPAARMLRDFHHRKLGIESDIVSVESIARNESPIDESALPDGIKDRNYGLVRPWDPTQRRGYDYELARKIQSHMRGRLKGTVPPRYVILLGSVDSIPPSYYFRVETPQGKWMGPTDQCYVATGQCLDPKSAVGRLPFETSEEVVRYLGKVEYWESTEFPADLTLFGGRAFDERMMFWGELSMLSLLPPLGEAWPTVVKRTRSKGLFNLRSVRELIYGQSPSPLAFYADHGTGNEMRIDEESVSAQELEDLLPEESQFPVIASLACNNAVVDETIVNESLLGPLSRGKYSFGSSAVRSRGGAVAYFGPNRVSLGDPVYTKDKFGNVRLHGGTYFLGLLAAMAETAAEVPPGTRLRLGDLKLRAERRYFSENPNRSIHNPMDRWTYFTFTLLGDPTLRLPGPRLLDKYAEPYSTTVFNPKADQDGTAVGRPTVLGYTSEVIVKASLYRVFGSTQSGPAAENLIATQTSVGSAVMDLEYEGKPLHNGNYLLTLENGLGASVESQVWFELQGASVIPYRP